MTPQQVTEMNAALAGKNTKKLKEMSKKLDTDASAAKTPEDATRMHELARIMSQPSL